MRTTRDRIRHALMFEVIGLLLAIPLGAVLFDKPAHDIGVVAIFTSLVATGWTYVYNLIFDRVLLRRQGHAQKTLALRVVHSMLFEGGLLLVSLPFIAIYLNIGLIEALIMDAAFVVFYLVYSFAYNWAYDAIFPMPAPPVSSTGTETGGAQASSSASQ